MKSVKLVVCGFLGASGVGGAGLRPAGAVAGEGRA